MATSANYEQRLPSAKLNSDTEVGDVIEERRKEPDGRITVCKYAKGKLLGKGGFAKCYVATCLTSSRTPYAIKIVNKSTLVKARARQKTEIKIHKTLIHQNIVRFERFFDDQDNAFMLLELCTNNSMSDLLRRRKRLTEPETRFYLLQLLEGLRYLHAEFVIHRDLKLGNLFLDSNLRIKVGDFGLATRVTHVDERKRTICGTPNYIAPEILENKNGHSYEVDIWSTGVVLYTLLYGKPPYESVDVKSTYKRILSNTYSFPENITTSEDSKHLIRSILQTRPEKRPSIDGIQGHPFFTRSSAFIPSSIPEIALREAPVFPQESCQSVAERVYQLATNSNAISDENDPNVLNRNQNRPNSANQWKLTKPTPLDAPADRGLSTNTRRSSLEDLRENDGPGRLSAASIVKPAVASSVTRQPLTSVDPNEQRALSSAHTRPLPSSQNFEIFNDNKSSGNFKTPGSGTVSATTTTTTAVPNSQIHAPSDRIPSRVKSASLSTGLGSEVAAAAKATSRTGRLQEQVSRRFSDGGSGSNINNYSEEFSRKNTYGSDSGKKSQDIDVLQVELEHVNLEQAMGYTAPLTAPVTDNHLANLVASAAVTSTGPRQEAWGAYLAPDIPLSTHRGSLPSSSKYSTPPVDSDPHHQNMDLDDFDHLDNDENLATDRCPITPARTSARIQLRDMGTLETMHDVLTKSFAATAQESVNPRSNDYPLNLVENSAKIWVVRYVDYTSKYGLGFLLSNGSAGVYFNDSTKIVQSPDGTIFQYVERRKRTGFDNNIQLYVMTAYPPELQKKVTLLRHFRNYLLDAEQRKLLGNGTNDADGNQAIESFGKHHDILPSALCFNSNATSEKYDGSSGIPYVKKWVRTRHAILFRLSNQTVQVVFFDQSEVLLSSEARVVTYVSKSGARSDHTLDDVLYSGRYDIAKRLKYTKDIMYRLISMPQK